MACRGCAEKAGFQEQVHRPENFGRAFLHSAAATLMGMLACAILAALTRWTIPVLAVAIGYAVGLSMKREAPPETGARYPLLAALLTYLAVAIGTLPAVITRGLVPSIADLSGGERLAAWALMALVSPFVQFAQTDNGVFVLVLLAAGMLFAAKQASSTKPQWIMGPFPQSSPR